VQRQNAKRYTAVNAMYCTQLFGDLSACNVVERCVE